MSQLGRSSRPSTFACPRQAVRSLTVLRQAQRVTPVGRAGLPKPGNRSHFEHLVICPPRAVSCQRLGRQLSGLWCSSTCSCASFCRQQTCQWHHAVINEASCVTGSTYISAVCIRALSTLQLHTAKKKIVTYSQTHHRSDHHAEPYLWRAEPQQARSQRGSEGEAD